MTIRRPATRRSSSPRARRLALGVLLAVVMASALHPVAAGAGPALGSDDRATLGARWIVDALSPEGLLPSLADPTKPDPVATAQAVSALGATESGIGAVDRMLDALELRVDDIATEGGTDSAGGLGVLIAAAVVGGREPRAFGVPPQDLVARLQALRRPDGLFGLADPTYDGAYRQGLALLGLAAAETTDAAAIDWLEAQQCASGLWLSYRVDTTQPCAPPDAAAYTGPDSNSTALAVMALIAQEELLGTNRSAATTAGVNALLDARRPDGGWNFILGTPMATDAASTALVAVALRMAAGVPDTGALAALQTFQVGCAGESADRGGVAYQPGPDGSLIPDAGSTAAAVVAFAGSPLPVRVGVLSPLGADPCSAAAPIVPTSAPTTIAPPPTAPGELPRTGSSDSPLTAGLLALGTGLALIALSRRR